MLLLEELAAAAGSFSSDTWNLDFVCLPTLEPMRRAAMKRVRPADSFVRSSSELPCSPPHRRRRRASRLMPASPCGGATIYPAPESPPIRDGVVIIRNRGDRGCRSAIERGAAIGNAGARPTGLVLVAGFWNSHEPLDGKQWAAADTVPPDQLAGSFREMLTRWGFTTVFDIGRLS